MTGSLRNRLLLGAGAGITLALAISGVVVTVLVQRALVEQFDDGLVARARALSVLVEVDGGTVEYEDISPDAPPGDYFQLYVDMQPVLRSRSLGDSNLTLDDGESSRGRQRGFVFTPRSDDGTASKALATIVYARSTAELDATIARVRTIVICVGAASVLLVLGILAWIARRGFAPVEVLARDIAAADFDKRVDEARPRELVVIAKRLNELLARLDRAFSRERQLTAEVAHELRTPLAGLRATMELALDRERTPERYRDALAQSLAITKQTERMVEAMLSLAKLDAGMIAIDTKPVALDELVREVLATHAADATTQLAPVTLRTDPVLLARVLHNLVDNAVCYGDGSLTVDVTAPGTLRITNPTTLAEATHVFERFWRGDAARTAGTHAGLGLAIAKELVELLGGTIAAEVRDGKFIATMHFRDER